MNERTHTTIMFVIFVVGVATFLSLAMFGHIRGMEAKRAHELALANYRECVIVAPTNQVLKPSSQQ